MLCDSIPIHSFIHSYNFHHSFFLVSDTNPTHFLILLKEHSFFHLHSSSFPSFHLTHSYPIWIREMVGRARELLLFFFALFSNSTVTKAFSKTTTPVGGCFCLSWRLAVETNNVRAWLTVPTQCMHYVESYMTNGQYDQDLELVVENILNYINTIDVSIDGMDAWILDVDDTCISNLLYYGRKRYGCEPYDPVAFKMWAATGSCPAIPAVLRLFNRLIGSGFKVFLVTGRDEESLGKSTAENLRNQGFVGYQRLIMRTEESRGQHAVVFKSKIRKGLIEEGYRIWGNVGDQWSDLQGDCLGKRTFKLPNPMYFVP